VLFCVSEKLRLEWERQQVQNNESKNTQRDNKNVTIRASENGITNQKLRSENKAIKLLALGLA
jgi:hypothetical protein